MTKSIQAQTCEGRGERGDSEASSSSRCFLDFTPNNATTIICTESSPIIRRRTRASGRTANYSCGVVWRETQETPAGRTGLRIAPLAPALAGLSLNRFSHANLRAFALEWALLAQEGL